MKSRSGRAFSLLEILVVIAIISLVMALIIPTIYLAWNAVLSLDFRLTSNAFGGKLSGTIPPQYGAAGQDISPPLQWSVVAHNARSLVITMVSNAGGAGQKCNWILYNLPPSLRSIPQGFDPTSVGGKFGLNDFDQYGYTGPAPPPGKTAPCYFEIYALDTPLDPGATPYLGAFPPRMYSHILHQAYLTGTYGP